MREEAMARVGPQCHKGKKIKPRCYCDPNDRFFPQLCVDDFRYHYSIPALDQEYTVKILVRINIGGGWGRGGWSVIRGQSHGQRNSVFFLLFS